MFTTFTKDIFLVELLIQLVEYLVQLTKLPGAKRGRDFESHRESYLYSFRLALAPRCRRLTIRMSYGKKRKKKQLNIIYKSKCLLELIIRTSDVKNSCILHKSSTSLLAKSVVFANGPGDLGSITGRVIPKTLKMVLNTQQYKVRIKGKVEQSRERSSALPYTSV